MKTSELIVRLWDNVRAKKSLRGEHTKGLTLCCCRLRLLNDFFARKPEPPLPLESSRALQERAKPHPRPERSRRMVPCARVLSGRRVFPESDSGTRWQRLPCGPPEGPLPMDRGVGSRLLTLGADNLQGSELPCPLSAPRENGLLDHRSGRKQKALFHQAGAHPQEARNHRSHAASPERNPE